MAGACPRRGGRGGCRVDDGELPRHPEVGGADPGDRRRRADGAGRGDRGDRTERPDRSRTNHPDRRHTGRDSAGGRTAVLRLRRLCAYRDAGRGGARPGTHHPARDPAVPGGDPGDVRDAGRHADGDPRSEPEHIGCTPLRGAAPRRGDGRRHRWGGGRAGPFLPAPFSLRLSPFTGPRSRDGCGPPGREFRCGRPGRWRTRRPPTPRRRR